MRVKSASALLLLVISLTGCSQKHTGKFFIVVPLDCVKSKALVFSDCTTSSIADCHKVKLDMVKGCEQVGVPKCK